MTWTSDGVQMRAAVRLVAATVLAHRPAWDMLDAAVGDGDFGSTMSRGFGALHGAPTDDADAPGPFLTDVAHTLIREMGGSSGPLWGVAFLRAAKTAGDRTVVGLQELAAMGRAAVDGIAEYGGATVGDCTLLDALVPAVEVLEAAAAAGGGDSQPDAAAVLSSAADAAAEGARRTRELASRRGRASYLGERTIGALDAGAVAVAVLFAALVNGSTAPAIAAELEPSATGSISRQSADGDPRIVSATKQLINEPDLIVQQSLAGFATAHAELIRWDPDARIVCRADSRPNVVGVVSGGGSGHEPLHAGFVGEGMLTAAIPGHVFASPSVDAIVHGMRVSDSGRGVLQIVKNYTGDVLNFRLAAEIAREDGMEVATVIVDDDIATSPEHGFGRRGTGATIFAEKIAGAAAAAGGELTDVADVARRVVERSVSLGIALSSCTPPGGSAIFELADHEVEIGVGIHGEAGQRRDRHRPAAELVKMMVGSLLEALQLYDDATLLALVSGLGGTPLIEQYVVFYELERQLAMAGHHVVRSLVGPYITSLNMAGVVVSVLTLDAELTRLWDAPVRTPALERAR